MLALVEVTRLVAPRLNGVGLWIEYEPRAGWYDREGWLSYHEVSGKTEKIIVVSNRYLLSRKFAVGLASAFVEGKFVIRTTDLNK